jgi:hypothetical protein
MGAPLSRRFREKWDSSPRAVKWHFQKISTPVHPQSVEERPFRAAKRAIGMRALAPLWHSPEEKWTSGLLKRDFWLEWEAQRFSTALYSVFRGA